MADVRFFNSRRKVHCDEVRRLIWFIVPALEFHDSEFGLVGHGAPPLFFQNQIREVVCCYQSAAPRKTLLLMWRVPSLDCEAVKARHCCMWPQRKVGLGSWK